MAREAIDVFQPNRRSGRRLKFGNIPTVVNGVRFDSKREAARYVDLCWLEKAGQIEGLRLQPKYPLVVNGQQVAIYRGDFEYHEGGVKILEDVKSVATRTPTYRLKAKLIQALYGLTIRETR